MVKFENFEAVHVQTYALIVEGWKGMTGVGEMAPEVMAGRRYL